MNTLYICSENAVAPCNGWRKKLTEKLNNAEKLIDAVISISSECSEFTVINFDAHVDVRNNLFTDESFEKSRDMENLKRETEEMIKLADSLRDEIDRAKRQMENLEFAYSEEFETNRNFHTENFTTDRRKPCIRYRRSNLASTPRTSSMLSVPSSPWYARAAMRTVWHIGRSTQAEKTTMMAYAPTRTFLAHCSIELFRRNDNGKSMGRGDPTLFFCVVLLFARKL